MPCSMRRCTLRRSCRISSVGTALRVWLALQSSRVALRVWFARARLTYWPQTVRMARTRYGNAHILARATTPTRMTGTHSSTHARLAAIAPWPCVCLRGVCIACPFSSFRNRRTRKLVLVAGMLSRSFHTLAQKCRHPFVPYLGWQGRSILLSRPGRSSSACVGGCLHCNPLLDYCIRIATRNLHVCFARLGHGRSSRRTSGAASSPARLA